MKKLIPSFFGAILFYTIIPLPTFIPINFSKIAVWLPFVGFLVGGLLGFIAYIFDVLGFSPFLQGILMVSLWIYLTGGLHLDGVMDTADGLAVQNPQKRLRVMSDSNTGAYGVMAGIVVILIKVATLTEIRENSWFYLIFSASWARWGQFISIVLYPYLKKEGKGAFLKESLNLPFDTIFSSLFIIPLVLIQYFWFNNSIEVILLRMLIGGFIPLLIGWWFYQQLGGHTGDTYGATVEWSEALILCYLTSILNLFHY
ncbi:adenosylcobinamide-GDP ribazoletransferase [Geminocystis sp. NIES-3709]|uniref:adenosylcobinamide-GDP ribazoletransferase n=1 Tax=Geminocystis sp. NIES-3709 TaxID=1617448 RepID=UPI0005FC89DE|nr:adenosylcobinamide-GDP ribazoletransferase [Geminocystis sp. NIES-3709]BAQ65695.1 cobalamin synthase [Geminocystis sp. NIES-3709]